MTESNEQPEKLDLRSHTIAEDKKQELLQLFPEIRTEGGKIDLDRLKLALGETVDVGRERYGMNWPGKADCFKTIQQPSMGTLLPCKEESVDFEKTENMIIEGDNLEVLKLLQKSYLGKVKMIYIDPPYNTGNDFIYPDNYTESLQTYLEYTGQVDNEGKKYSTNTEADGRFHSKWMNMMYPRVYAARNLLSDTGFILCAIDDAELSNLRRIFDEIFGEENHIANLVYEKNRKNDAKFFSVGHEYFVVYAKNKLLLRETGVYLRAEKEGLEEVRQLFEELRIKYSDDWEKVREGLKEYFTSLDAEDPRQALARYTKVDKYGPFRDDGNISWPGGGGPRYEVLHPVTKKPCKIPSRGWVYPKKNTMDAKIDEGLVVFGPDENTIPSIRTNLFDKTTQVMNSVHFSYAQTATQELMKLFSGEKIFDNPKHVPDIKTLIQYLTEKDDTVLDFFAGSGTTAHAVLDLNKQDSGNRKFILVQLPEPTGRPDYKTIADITKERVRRVIKKIKDEEATRPPDAFDADKPTPDLGFKVFKLSESNFKTWNPAIPPGDTVALEQQLELHIDHIRPGRSQDDILYEILLKSGFPLSTKIETLTLAGKPVYSIAEGGMLICLERNLTQELIKAIADKKPMRVVCLDEGFTGNDQLKTNAVQTMKAKGVVSFRTV